MLHIAGQEGVVDGHSVGGAGIGDVQIAVFESDESVPAGNPGIGNDYATQVLIAPDEDAFLFHDFPEGDDRLPRERIAQQSINSQLAFAVLYGCLELRHDLLRRYGRDVRQAMPEPPFDTQVVVE